MIDIKKIMWPFHLYNKCAHEFIIRYATKSQELGIGWFFVGIAVMSSLLACSMMIPIPILNILPYAIFSSTLISTLIWNEVTVNRSGVHFHLTQDDVDRINKEYSIIIVKSRNQWVYYQDCSNVRPNTKMYMFIWRTKSEEMRFKLTEEIRACNAEVF